MPIISTPDHSLHLVVTVCSEPMTLQCVEQYHQDVWLEPSLYGYNELFDLADCEFNELSFGELIGIAEKASKLYMLDPNSRFSFLARTPKQQQLADFYIAAKTMASGRSRVMNSFSCRDRAMQWLTETS